jgi:hypothetical protein
MFITFVSQNYDFVFEKTRTFFKTIDTGIELLLKNSLSWKKNYGLLIFNRRML